MIVFDSHSFAHRLGSITDLSRFIIPTALKQSRVQIGPICDTGHRYAMVSAEVSGFTFHTAFLVTFTWSAKLRLKFPMGPKRNEPIGFFATVSTQNLFDRTPQVVVPQHPEHP
jgi:hypothetical protein